MGTFEALLIAMAIFFGLHQVADALREQQVTTTVIFKIDDGAAPPDAPRKGT